MTAKACPYPFPFTFHRTLAVVDQHKRLSQMGHAAMRGKREDSCEQTLNANDAYARESAGEVGACNTIPALTINASEERRAMTLVTDPTGGLQPESCA